MDQQVAANGFWPAVRARAAKTVTVRLAVAIPLQIVALAAFALLSPGILRRMTAQNSVNLLSATLAQSSAEPEGLGIETFVRDVKAELARSEQSEKELNHRALFAIKPFDLELSFIAQTSNKATGKVDYKVITAESEANIGAQKVQKLSLHFDAIPPEKGSTAQSTDEPPSAQPQVVGDVPPPKETAR